MRVLLFKGTALVDSEHKDGVARLLVKDGLELRSAVFGCLLEHGFITNHGLLIVRVDQSFDMEVVGVFKNDCLGQLRVKELVFTDHHDGQLLLPSL